MKVARSTPESPTTPDTPTTTIYPFSLLTGTWVASNGSATKTDVDSGAGLGSRIVGQNNISFSDIQVNGDTAVVSTKGAGVQVKESTPYIEADFEGALSEVRVLW